MKKLAEHDGALRCFVHPDRPATHFASVPCATGGGLPLCEECARPESERQVFELYLKRHMSNIVQCAVADQVPRRN